MCWGAPMRKTGKIPFLTEPTIYWRQLRSNQAGPFLKERKISNSYKLCGAMVKSSGEGNGNPLQYSCLENSMDTEAWQATVQGVAKSRIWLSNYTRNTHSSVSRFYCCCCCCCWVMSDSLRPHGLQHARLPCPSPSSEVCSNSCPLSWWCHPTISCSVAPSPSAFNLSQDQGLFQWVHSLHRVAKAL